MLIVADALYANTPVMDLCQSNLWDYLLVIKEGVLKDLNEEISLRPDKKIQKTNKGQLIYLNDLPLQVHQLSWLRWEEAGNRFSWITNMEIKDAAMATKLQETGRLRWKIDDEGFNTQKNLGYNLAHKYSRINFNATKNYYQCMQIALLIEQLALLGKTIKNLLDTKTSIIKLSERLRNILALINIKVEAIEHLLERKVMKPEWKETR